MKSKLYWLGAFFFFCIMVVPYLLLIVVGVGCTVVAKFMAIVLDNLVKRWRKEKFKQINK